MTSHQNLIGALTWIATGDSEASDDLNGLWAAAKTEIDKFVAAIYLGQATSADVLDRAKAQLIAYSVEGRIKADGHTAANEETRAIPATSWTGAVIFDVESAIGKSDPLWLGVHFKKVDLRKLWPAKPGPIIAPPKKRTGPVPIYRERIAGILRQHEIVEANAIARGEEPPPRPTSKQVTERLSEAGKRVSERTVRHNIDRILSGNVTNVRNAIS